MPFIFVEEKWLVGFLWIGRSYKRLVDSHDVYEAKFVSVAILIFLVAVERRASWNRTRRTQRIHSVESIHCYCVFRCGICVPVCDEARQSIKFCKFVFCIWNFYIYFFFFLPLSFSHHRQVRPKWHSFMQWQRQLLPVSLHVHAAMVN